MRNLHIRTHTDTQIETHADAYIYAITISKMPKKDWNMSRKGSANELTQF
jgi:hypothetical protein